MKKRIQCITLAQVVAYIAETRAETRGSASTVFRLAELTDIYSSCLAQLGVEVSGRVHSNDFKERLLAIVPGLQANKKGRDSFLAFNREVKIGYDYRYKYLKKVTHMRRQPVTSLSVVKTTEVASILEYLFFLLLNQYNASGSIRASSF